VVPADLAAKGLNRTFGDMLTPAGLAEIATYAGYVAPNFRAIIPLGPDGQLTTPTGLAANAHAAGLLLGTWTFRPENCFLASDFRGAGGDSTRNPEGSIAEIQAYLAAGVDALFTDDPAIGRKAVDAI
jgi:glycerophosphoryl diester phosphodiesterase